MIAVRWEIGSSNKQKLPNGLEGLAKSINQMGMQFGLWVEPEMVSVDSELYRKHPDWCIHVPNRPRSEGRNQLVLDYSRKEVCDYIIQVISDVLASAPISYVKWDIRIRGPVRSIGCLFPRAGGSECATVVHTVKRVGS